MSQRHKSSIPAAPDDHQALIHLEPAPPTPEQWEAWVWLWKKLLIRPPAQDQAQQADPYSDREDHQVDQS